MASDQEHPYRTLELPRDGRFELRPSAGKGWGAFATKPITKGTKILVEKAWYAVSLKPAIGRTGVTQLGITNALQSLSREQQNFVLSMHARFSQQDLDDWLKTMPAHSTANVPRTISAVGTGPNTQGEQIARDHVFKNNAFRFSDGEQMQDVSAGFYPVASRLNYACRPNCYRPTHDKEVVIFTTHDITSGEELTLPLLGYQETLTMAERDNRLSFKCLCDLCTAGPGVRLISDLRRQLIRACHYVIFGCDRLAAVQHKVSYKNPFARESLRHVVENFRLPIGKRFVYCCLALALTEAEMGTTVHRVEELGFVANWCYELFQDPANKAVAWRALDIGIDQRWTQAFAVACGLWMRGDPADAMASGALKELLQKETLGGGVAVSF